MLPEYAAALDTGAGHISAVAVRWENSGDFTVLAYHTCPSSGLSRGVVTDLSEATASVENALAGLVEKAGKKIHKVYISVNSTSVSVVPAQGILLLSRYGREVSQRDINRCVAVGSTIRVPLERQVLHSMVRGFSVDGEIAIRNPLNMEAVKLGVNMNMLTISSSAVRNIANCVARAGYIPERTVFSGLASSYRLLGEEERMRGVALVEIDRDISTVVVFHGGAISGCRVFPAGYREVVLNGCFDEDPLLSEIVERSAGIEGWKTVRSVVLGGEGGCDEPLLSALEERMALPVKPGACAARPFGSIPPEKASYVTCLGILDHVKETRTRELHSRNVLKRCASRFSSFLDKYF